MNNRFLYYTKTWTTEKITINIPEYSKTFKQNELYFYDGIIKKPINGLVHGTNIYGFYWDQGSSFSLNIPCLTISADGIDNHQLPALVKVRYINDIKGGIICPLEYDRHFGEIKSLILNDIIWNNKINTCIWRGAPTGICDYGNLPNEWKNLRMMFCYKYRDIYDVGINTNMDRWDISYVKSILSIKDMLKYKYQISIPGNDKDSGLIGNLP